MAAFGMARDFGERAQDFGGRVRDFIPVAMPHGNRDHGPDDENDGDDEDDDAYEGGALDVAIAPARPAARASKTKTPVVDPRPKRAKTGRKAEARRQQTLPLGVDDDYVQPPLEILDIAQSTREETRESREALQQNARYLSTVLEEYGVKGEIVKVRPGPVVTLYELEPAPGTKTSRVIGLSDDIARSMSAVSVRVAAGLPSSLSTCSGLSSRTAAFIASLTCCCPFTL